MHGVFATNKAEAVLLADAENAFISINREIFQRKIKHICSPTTTFVRKSYNVLATLFVLGGKGLLSYEGTTQGDSAAMAAYGIALTPLL